MEKITIFTPTYNRREVISNLHNSLKNQTRGDFRWLIVDDGSVDGTEEMVTQWQATTEFEIEYVFQNNQGKCAAIKTGIVHCKTPWFICVDSDDTLAPDAVENMLQDICNPLPRHCVGYIYPQKMENEEGVRWLPEKVTATDVMDLKNLYGIRESAILVHTECLRKIDIPQYSGERFLSEEVIYIQLSAVGQFVPRNRAFYLSEYQQGGITRNLFKHWLNNPQGTLLLLRMRYVYCNKYSLPVCVRERVKSILNLNALCLACHLKIREHTPCKWASALLYVPALFWKEIRFR